MSLTNYLSFLKKTRHNARRLALCGSRQDGEDEQKRDADCFLLKKKTLPIVFQTFEKYFFSRVAHNLSSPKPGHTTGGSGRGAWRRGGAGSGRTGCQQNYPPERQASLVPSKESRTYCLNFSPEARTSEILGKPMEEQSPRLTTGSSAVYQRDKKRSLFLAATQWADAFLSL